MPGSREQLKTIWFEGQMLPKWAQMLDVAARLASVPAETQRWFSRFTNSSGVEDSRTIQSQCSALRDAFARQRADIIRQLDEVRVDQQRIRIVAAWEYSLDTMLQAASAKPTCSWRVEGLDESDGFDGGDGGITLRRPS